MKNIAVVLFVLLSVVACRRNSQPNMVTKACSYKTVPLGVVFYDTSYQNEAHTCLDNELDLEYFTQWVNYGVVKEVDIDNGLYTYDEFAPFKYVIGAKNGQMRSHSTNHTFKMELDNSREFMCVYVTKMSPNGTPVNDYTVKIRFKRSDITDLLVGNNIDYFRNNFNYESYDVIYVNRNDITQPYSGTLDVNYTYIQKVKISFYNARNRNDNLFKKAAFGSDHNLILRDAILRTTFNGNVSNEARSSMGDIPMNYDN